MPPCSWCMALFSPFISLVYYKKVVVVCQVFQNSIFIEILKEFSNIF